MHFQTDPPTMRDPFIPRPPDKNQIGRMWSPSGLKASWPCRWCGRALYAPRAGIAICVRCDNGESE